jgi:inorganic pyrophosphatase
MARVLTALLLAAYQVSVPPQTLPSTAVESLRASLAAAAPHAKHLWRDTPPINDDRTVNGYIEIPRGERRKFEFDIAQHERRIDRVMSPEVGGYPINYGFVPQTVSYDGDPFDILVLGPALRGGGMIRGVIVGIMHMEDEKGLDSKVLVSLTDSFGRATHTLRSTEQRRVTEFFNRYKRDEPGKFSRVLGWGGIGEGRAYVNQTHAFFKQCGSAAGDCAATAAADAEWGGRGFSPAASWPLSNPGMR